MVAVGSLLEQHLPACFAFVVVVGFFFMVISSSRQCGVVVVGSLLEQDLPACFAFVVVSVFCHGHLSQQAVRCGGCWLSS